MVVTGFVFAMHSLGGAVIAEQPFPPKGGWSFLPIFAVLLLVALFHIELQYALMTLVLILFIFYRYSLHAVFSTLKHGFSVEVIMLILGVMFFKEAMDNSGAVRNLSQFFLSEGIPVLPILFLLPFLTGLLTGITVGFVGSTFPLIISIAGSTSISAISFAFAAGFLGVLLSPVHICLILTREYFKADIWGIYKLMIPGCIVIFMAAVAQYLLLT
jgi:integral membrane protein (TIGR00529 family)